MGITIPTLILGYRPSQSIIDISVQCTLYVNLLLALTLLLSELITTRILLTLWYITLFLSLSFTGVYLCIINNYHIIYCVNFIISFIALLLFCRLLLALIFSLLSFLSSILIYEALVPLNTKHPYGIPDFPKYSIIIMLIVISYTIYQKFKERQLKQYALEAFSNSIAHDIKNPLSMISMEIELIEDAIKNNNMQNLNQYLAEIEQCSKQAIQDVNIIINSVVDQKSPEDWGSYSVLNCIKESVKHYYMTEDQKKQISILDSGYDFTFTGSATLFRHVMFNLIKNALFYAGSHAKINIFIHSNEVHIKDNGYGIRKEILNNIFNKYITTKGHGIGLSFCKQAMNKMNGNIKCYSQEGDGAEFVLYFNNKT